MRRLSNATRGGCWEAQRLQNVPEDTGTKLDCVVSDVLGKSARAMLAALIAGERDLKVLSELELGRMRPRVGALEQALLGRFCDHHARQCSKMLAHIGSPTDELTG
jgi:transposase